MNLHFKDKKVFICSGDTDLGAACVIEFLNENAQVNTTALSIKKIERLFKKFDGDISHKNLKIHEADITNFNDINLLEDQIKKSEVLITHTPSPASGDFIQWNEKDWLNALNNNLVSVIKIINLALPEMNKKKLGSILNISSMTTLYPMNNLELSTASRTALEGFIKSIAKKNEFPNVSINSILPGYFLTDSLEQYLNNQTESKKNIIESELLNKIPAGRFGDPKEFAKACCFLCSHHASFFKGQSFLMNGGQVT